MCDKEEETLKHIFEICPETKIGTLGWKVAVNGRKDSFRYLNTILWKRRKKESEEKIHAADDR